VKRCLQIRVEDNVATLLEDATAETVEVLGLPERQMVGVRGHVPHGHKVAIRAIPQAAAVVKYGVPIGVATCEIAAGEWVHLHNCRSMVDERSGSFDHATGAATDTRYE
jgi:altronate dehydratase small subunit